MTVILFPGLDSGESLTRFGVMRTESGVAEKRRPPARAKSFKVGDRARFGGNVLRSMGDKVLVQVEANGTKLMFAADHFQKKCYVGESIVLFGTVTRIGESMVEDLVPVSIAVDGYTAMRVTLAVKSVKRA